MMASLVCLEDFESYAFHHLDKNALDYYRSGANFEQTLKDNRNAFKRWRLRPRVLVDVSARNLSTTILGTPVLFPVGISPTAMQRMAHPDGEIAVAKAAKSLGICNILSTLSTTSLEDVAEGCPGCLRWFQLYVYNDRDMSAQLVRRAERNGYKAIVLTVDTPMLGRRLADHRNKFVLPRHLSLENFGDLDEQKAKLVQKVGLVGYASTLFDKSLSWKDVQWLRSITRLPIVVKGILTAEAAREALACGVDAIMVSNHGARQLDGVLAAIDALPEVVKAVNNQCEVYLDGGVMTGTDILKCLGLGARAVFIGRPVLWGLVHSGEAGVRKVLEILRDELDVAMALSGCPTIADIKEGLVVHQSYYTSKL